MRAGVLDLDQDQAGLDARDVHGADADRVDPVALSDVEEAVPHGDRAVEGHPQLVPAVARVPRSRHVDVDVRDLGPAPAEVPNVLPVLAARLLQDLPREPALQREPGGLIADVLDVGVEAGRVHAEPAFARIGGGDPVGVLGQPSDRAVVDHLAVLVAPRRVEDLVDLEPRDVSGHHAVEQAVRRRAHERCTCRAARRRRPLPPRGSRCIRCRGSRRRRPRCGSPTIHPMRDARSARPHAGRTRCRRSQGSFRHQAR